MNDADWKIVEEYLSTVLATQPRIFRAEVYKALQNKLGEPRDEATFCAELSKALKERPNAFKVAVGRFGGIQLKVPLLPEDPKKPGEPEAPKDIVKEILGETDVEKILERKTGNLVAAEKALPKLPASHRHARHIWIGRKLFRVPRSWDDITRLVCDVLEGAKDSGGNVVFNGERYRCPHPEILERFLRLFLFALPQGESDPLLNDGSGVPVELRVLTP